MAAPFNTDKYNLGSPQGSTTGVYPQIIPFSTAVSPGSAIPVSQSYAQSDIIGLAWIPTPGKLYGYHIEVPVVDGAASSTISLDLIDGCGNVLATGIVGGRSFNSGIVINHASSYATAPAQRGKIGTYDYVTASLSYVALACATAAVGANSASANVRGYLIVKQD